MEQIVRMLEKPQRYFTAHASWYGVVQTYTVSEITPFFWEDECVMFYVRSGSGFLRVNQTLYPLSQGCFCSMHQFHVFRFEASSEEPLCMEVLIYPTGDGLLCQQALPKMIWLLGIYSGSACLSGGS